jgi:POT family proton-dependent oligopeptide transporter
LSNIILGLSFAIIWGIVIWKIDRNLNTYSYDINFPAIVTTEAADDGGEAKKVYTAITGTTQVPEDAVVEQQSTSIRSTADMKAGDKTYMLDLDKRGTYRELTPAQMDKVAEKVEATVVRKRENEVEIPATWFLILNSLFIIIFAPLFSKWWESKYNPAPSVKYGLGLILLGIGFAALAFGSLAIPQGAKVASVSIIWLVLAYLFHTLGELCLSPVSLSYISKLVPARMIDFMFGVWYLAIAIGKQLAGVMGGKIDAITEEWSLTTFFLIFTLIPAGMGLIAVVISPFINKLMHGVR